MKILREVPKSDRPRFLARYKSNTILGFVYSQRLLVRWRRRFLYELEKEFSPALRYLADAIDGAITFTRKRG